MYINAIHIGLHKCASTSMQRYILAQHPEIDFSWNEHKEIFLKHLILYPMGFSPELFNRRLDGVPWPSKPEGKVNVFSCEALSGQMYCSDHSRIRAELLRQTFAYTKIILVLREPMSYLVSAYNQYVKEGGVLKIKDFLRHPASPAKGIISKVLYADYLDHLYDLFPSHHVHVMFLEQLAGDEDSALSKLYSFLGVDPTFRPVKTIARTSLHPKVTRGLRWANRLSKNYHNEAGLFSMGMYRMMLGGAEWMSSMLGKSGCHVMMDKLRGIVTDEERDCIRLSNTRLAKMLRVDLGEWGYETDKLPRFAEGALMPQI